MLSDEEMRRIEAEEVAAARALQEQEERARHRLALHSYRREVRVALRPRAWWWPVRWLLPFIPVLAGAGLFLRPAPAVPDDTSGGVANSALMERCRAEVGTRLGQEGLRFPEPREAVGQFSANTDGKRWDGWVGTPDGTRTDFSCSFTVADGSVALELIQEEEP